MRIRLFLSFTIVIVVTLVILGFVIQTNTQTTLTRFAQRGGFLGADRAVAEYTRYYQENGSWDQIGRVPATGGHMGGQGSQGGQGNPGGSSGMGGNDQAGPGGMNMYGMGSSNQLTLTDQNGIVLASQSLTIGDQISADILGQSFPIRVNGHIVGYLTPDSSLLDLSKVISQELAATLSKSLLPTALVSGAIALILSLVFATILMRPVRQLTQAADQIASGNLAQRVPASGNDEIGQLAVSFNQMADSLEDAQQSRQAMTADIAHELRTPLSIQRANLEALQDGLYPMNLDNLAPIIQQNHLLGKLVDDLRTLALADAGALDLDLVETDLAGLLERIREDYQARFVAAGIGLSLETPPACPTFRVDPARINQVIYNLLQNSLRHTPSGGSVKLKMNNFPGEVVITIRDTGEGIPVESLPHLFERFFRSDQSRSRDHGGSGLGLTIARQIIEAHHGSLNAANHPEGGAVFTIRLADSSR